MDDDPQVEVTGFEVAGFDDVQAGPDEQRVDEQRVEEQPDELPDVPEPPVTGDGTVDDAVARLAGMLAQPLEQQVQAYDAVHRALQDRLADVEG